MNKTYRSVWNESTGTWVAVQENANARGKKSRSGTKLAVAFLAANAAAALTNQALAGSLDGGASSAGPNSLRYGPGASAVQDGDIAIGWNSSANSLNPNGSSKNFATAIGSYSVASNSQATAVGGFASATNGAASAFGYGATASGWDSSAIGQFSTASGKEATALGQNARATTHRIRRCVLAE
ncbi:ESPR-type extended signal peptide-containing protein [Paraburkholderia bannensis]|uniref:ESPR-type extended signal peptide-containing protein n=1 Tax=Paraburkholderia bannensis TaxID=765414 RepID=UPI002ABE737E|nr:ESPR-type extended signal peptide-containing protein [Paraburkholderia bannensis]